MHHEDHEGHEVRSQSKTNPISILFVISVSFVVD
jgi:hypothetical protein